MFITVLFKLLSITFAVLLFEEGAKGSLGGTFVKAASLKGSDAKPLEPFIAPNSFFENESSS